MVLDVELEEDNQQFEMLRVPQQQYLVLEEKLDTSSLQYTDINSEKISRYYAHIGTVYAMTPGSPYTHHTF